MSELKATPGPWSVRRLIDNDGAPFATSYTAHLDLEVCMVWAPPGNVEQEANAHLIAAAPELYEALIEAKRQLEECEQEITGECYNSPQINAALAKARGEQS